MILKFITLKLITFKNSNLKPNQMTLLFSCYITCYLIELCECSKYCLTPSKNKSLT